MKRKMKVTLSLLLVVAMVFGNGFTSFAQNTSIHLKVASELESIIKGKTIQVVVVHDAGTPSESVSTLTMETNNYKLYTVLDGGNFVTTVISHFLIDGITYTYGPTGEIVPGVEGNGGTLNCDLVKLPDVTLTYDANGAESGAAPESQTMMIYSMFTVSDNIGALALSGHIFDGWNTKADGTGDDYVIGSSYSIGTNNLTLFAQWKPVYPVNYHANPVSGFTLSGSVPTDSNDYQVAQDVTVMGKETLTLKNHTFAGWTLTSTGEGAVYVSGDKIPMVEGGLDFYAKWIMNQKYSVSYDGNGNTGGSAPTGDSYFEDEIVTVSGEGDLVKDGFTFNGWNTEANGTGTQRAAGATFPMEAANVVFYAQWKQNQVDPIYFTVTYNLNEGSGSVPVDENNYEQGDLVTVKESEVTRAGYKFLGWAINAAGTGNVYNSLDTFSMPASDVILYAVWAPLYSVTYYPNYEGGVAPVDDTKYLSGDKVTVLEEMTRQYFDFMNWNTLADGSGIPYESGDEFLIENANVVLYAQWDEHEKFSVTYDPNGANGGTVPVDSGMYYKDQSTTVLGNINDLTRTGFNFIGWNTAANGDGTSYAQGESLIFSTGDIVLYAMWQIEEDNPPQPTTSSEEPSSEEPPSEEPPSEEPPTEEPPTPAPTEPTEDITNEPPALSAPREFFDVDQFLGEPVFEEVVEIEIDEPTPLGSALPQTGQLPAELFYGIGGLITAAGAFMKRKK